LEEKRCSDPVALAVESETETESSGKFHESGKGNHCHSYHIAEVLSYLHRNGMGNNMMVTYRLP